MTRWVALSKEIESGASTSSAHDNLQLKVDFNTIRLWIRAFCCMTLGLPNSL